MEKFDRNYRLVIQRDGDEEIVLQYPLTLDFTIRRANQSMAATADFRILNLSVDHRQRIFKNPWETAVMMTLRLEAGYKNNLSTVFNGNIFAANSARPEGSLDFITSISAFDYGFVMTNAKSNVSLVDAKASKDSVIRTLCGDMKYAFNSKTVILPIGAIGLFDKTPRTKYQYAGNTWEALKTETENQCYIDNGKIFCMGENEVVTGSVPEISNNTGLLGSPRTDGMWVIAEMIFEPGLIVGQSIVLKSNSTGFQSKDQAAKNPDKTYKIIGLEHAGIISGAVSGKCKTRVTLSPGSADKTNPFTVI
jgi:hypothetical protein